MTTAIFGLGNAILDLFVTLALISLVAIWGALIVFTFNDARKRLSDPFLIACATAGAFFPFVGTLVYTILRPPELLDDVQERDWDLKATQAVLRQHRATSCRKCGYPAEPDFLKCPSCRSRLREPCPSCDRPVGVEWKLCPYCEKTLIEPSRKSGRRKQGSEAGGESGRTPKARSTRSRDESGAAGPESGTRPQAAERRTRKSTTKSTARSADSTGTKSRTSKPRSAGSSSGRSGSPSEGKSEASTAETPTPRKSSGGGGSRRTAERPINSPDSGDDG